MTDIDWDDDANIESWCAKQHQVAAQYLELQPAKFGALGEWPAWHVAPYVSVWAVESVAAPGKVGWWVICSDLPTDYASSAGVPDPRSAVSAFAERWRQMARAMERGEKHESVSIGEPGDAATL